MLEIILLKIIPEVIGLILMVWLFTRLYDTMKPVYRVIYIIIILFLLAGQTVNIATTIAIKKMENLKRVQPVIEYPHLKKNKEITNQLTTYDEKLTVAILEKARILNNNINLFIKEFNKKYKTGYIYKIKVPKEREREKEKSIETIEKLYGMQNAISEITYAVKSGKKENSTNKILLNMRRYQGIPEELRMLDKKIGSLIEEMNKKYKTRFMYKVNALNNDTDKKSVSTDKDYIAEMNVQIEEIYKYIRE